MIETFRNWGDVIEADISRRQIVIELIRKGGLYDKG